MATRDSVKCRRLIKSGWYQARWGARYQLTGDQNQKNRFENTATGYRVVPMSSGTGERGDYVVVDDPHSVDQAESEVERSSAIEWWNGSMATRVNDFASGHKVVIQHWLHEADLTGDLLVKASISSDRRRLRAVSSRGPIGATVPPPAAQVLLVGCSTQQVEGRLESAARKRSTRLQSAV